MLTVTEMNGFQVIRIIQEIPLPQRDSEHIRGIVMRIDKNRSLPVPDDVARDTLALATHSQLAQ